jgi:hypothetical protein
MNGNTPKPTPPSMPGWWETLREYLTPEQQGLFMSCYQTLFHGKHSRSILWALVNLIGLLSTIQHNVTVVMVHQIDEVRKLRAATEMATQTLELSKDSVTEAGRRVHEAANLIRSTSISWETLFCIGLVLALIEVCVFLAALQVYLHFMYPPTS